MANFCKMYSFSCKGSSADKGLAIYACAKLRTACQQVGFRIASSAMLW